MQVLFAAVALLLSQGEEPKTWIARRPLEAAVFDHSTRVAVEGPWTAATQEYPERAPRPQAHRPDVPWRLVLQGPDGLHELASSKTAHSGWGAPRELAVAADGTVVATWRIGHEVLYASPDRPIERWTLHEGDFECAGLTPEWIAHWDRRTRELSVTPLSAAGAGERRRVEAPGPALPRDVAFDAHWLAWSDRSSTLRWIAATGGAPRELRIPAEGRVELDAVVAGHALLREVFGAARVHLVALESGGLASFAVPAAAIRVTPEGTVHPAGIYDPLDGSFVRCDTFRPSLGSPFLRTAPGVLVGKDDSGWFELSLDAERVPVPPESSTVALPEFPPLAADETSVALRARWNALRLR